MRPIPSSVWGLLQGLPMGSCLLEPTNAAYPSGLCAERTTLFAANAQYPDQPVLALAIAARKGNRFLQAPISPCGACRQVISGVEDRFNHPIRILLYGTEGVYECSGIDALLPLRFVDADMRL